MRGCADDISTDIFNEVGYGYALMEDEHGNPEGAYWMGMYILEGKAGKRNNEEAFYWIFKSAKQGCLKAQLKLAYLYEEGIGVQKDDKKALLVYKTAAENAEKKLQQKKIPVKRLVAPFCSPDIEGLRKRGPVAYPEIGLQPLVCIRESIKDKRSPYIQIFLGYVMQWLQDGEKQMFWRTMQGHLITMRA